MHQNLPPEARRTPEAAARYHQDAPAPATRIFIPKLNQRLNFGGQLWRIAEVKSRGRWKAVYEGEDEPRFKPETGMALNFQEPGILQEIYQAKGRKFWAKPWHIKPAGKN